MPTSPPDIVLHVQPGVVQSWDEFRQTKPPFSIALDGFVDAAPEYCLHGPYANFDHHRGVSRLATRSTVGQILVAINLGLFETFQQDQKPFANVYVNDCDQDVCLSYWLLKNAHLASGLSLDMDIARLIIGEDLLDASSGAYPIDPCTPLARKMAWTFELYDEVRASSRLHLLTREEMRGIVEATCERLTLLSDGKALERELQGEYEVLGGGAEWGIVREHGTHARTKLFADGIRAFVAVRARSDTTFDYSVGRMSPFIPFPLDKIFHTLNVAENRTDSRDCWGGSDIIGGSPRSRGSRLTPAEIEQIINQLLDEEKQAE